MTCPTCYGEGRLCECDGVIGASQDDPSVPNCGCTVPTPVDCESCQGLGYTSDDEEYCFECQGYGDIEVGEELVTCRECNGTGDSDATRNGAG